MNRWILIVLPSIFLFGFGAAELSQTLVEIKYPSNWPKPNYDFETKPLTKEKIELGRKLFYDPILSEMEWSLVPVAIYPLPHLLTSIMP